MLKRALHWIGAGLLVSGAAFLSDPPRGVALIGLMLFYPLFDRTWNPPAWPRGRIQRGATLVVGLVIVVLLAWQPHSLTKFIVTLLWAALPEEWFFRGYFQSRLGGGWRANLITSSLFALLHAITRGGVTALLVFVPSIIYGWLYQRTRNLPLVILVHALSNLVYLLGFGVWLSQRLTPI